jgi:hypothetical protein
MVAIAHNEEPPSAIDVSNGGLAPMAFCQFLDARYQFRRDGVERAVILILFAICFADCSPALVFDHLLP